MKFTEKRVSLILIIFVFGSCKPLTGNAETAQKPYTIENLIEEIGDIEESLTKSSDQLKESKTAVIALGHTRQGKSTVLNLLARKKLEVFKDGRFIRIKVEDPVEGMSIGDTAQSVTRRPHFWYNSEEKIAFFDTPGFCDSEPLHELRNAYTLRKLFSTNGNIRIMLVVSEGSLLPDGASSFVNSIQLLSSMFSQDLATLGNALCLVVTKQSEFVEAADVGPEIKKTFLDALDKTLSQESKTLLKTAEKWPVVLMPKASNERLGQRYLGEQAEAALRGNFMSAVKKCSDLTAIVPSLQVSAQAKIKARDISKKLSAEISKMVTGDFLREVIGSIEREMKVSNDADSARTLLTGLATKLDPVSTDDVIHKVSSLLESLNAKEQLALLKKKRVMLDFLKTVDQEMAIDFSEIVPALVACANAVKKFCVAPQEIGRSSKEYESLQLTPSTTIIIEGYVVGLSDIKRIVHERNVSKIIVFAFHTLYLDLDHLSLKGITLCIISPNWAIKKSARISLKGDDGDPGKAINTNSFGTDGNPGNPGKNGGNFFGRFLAGDGEILKRLEIDVSGGKGGAGTDGAPGKPGEDRKASAEKTIDGATYTRKVPALMDLTIPHVQLQLAKGNHKNYYLNCSFNGGAMGCLFWRGGSKRSESLARLRNSDYFVAPFTRTRSGQKGTDGGPGGRGGAGGSGGHGGKIDCGERKIPLKVEKGDGDQGKNGSGGEGGKGGKGSEGHTTTGWVIDHFEYPEHQDNALLKLLNAKLAALNKVVKTAAIDGNPGSKPLAHVPAVSAAPSFDLDEISKKSMISAYTTSVKARINESTFMKLLLERSNKELFPNELK